MSTEPLSVEELRGMVTETLREHHITLEEFLNADIDDFNDWELRDLYLMTHNVLKGDIQ